MKTNPTWLPVVALALRLGDGRWLMHQRPADKQHGGLWEFPGGKVESGENPRLALVRELKEELAIEVAAKDLHPCAFADSPADRPTVILLYTCSIWEGEPQSCEGGAVEWFDAAGMRALPKPPLDHDLVESLITSFAL